MPNGTIHSVRVKQVDESTVALVSYDIKEFSYMTSFTDRYEVYKGDTSDYRTDDFLVKFFFAEDSEEEFDDSWEIGEIVQEAVDAVNEYYEDQDLDPPLPSL